MNLMRHFFLLLIFSSFIFSCAIIPSKNPNPQTDAYWAEMTKTVLKQKSSIVELLQHQNVHLYNQMKKDAKDPVLLSLWGESLNMDAGARKQILPEAIIADLQAVFNIHNDNKIVHAGITHTYGYLFSILETPYGFKRKRWIAPTMNNGLALANQSLSPWTSEGTMLSNVTYFAGRAAFKSTLSIAALDKLTNVAGEVKNYDYPQLNTVAVEEIPAIESNSFMIRTTLVEFPVALKDDDNTHLLIYSLLDTLSNSERLITVFPVKLDVYNSLLEPTTIGQDRPMSLRYNGYHPVLSKALMRGKRMIFRRQ